MYCCKCVYCVGTYHTLGTKRQSILHNLKWNTNKNWTNKIPNYHITKQLRTSKNISSVIKKKKLNQPLINDFMLNIIYLS